MSANQNIEDFQERLIFQDFTETFFVFCMTCDEEKNKFLQIGEMADILPSKCIECESTFPLCKTCQNNLNSPTMGKIRSFDIIFFLIFLKFFQLLPN